MTGNSGGAGNTFPAPPKRRGRPATGRDPEVKVRIPPRIIESIDRWAGKFRDLGRPAAIRALIELRLRAGRKSNQVVDPKGYRLHERKVPLAKRRRLASTKAQPRPPLLRLIRKES
jgi:hypothetical protein